MQVQNKVKLHRNNTEAIDLSKYYMIGVIIQSKMTNDNKFWLQGNVSCFVFYFDIEF